MSVLDKYLKACIKARNDELSEECRVWWRGYRSCARTILHEWEFDIEDAYRWAEIWAFGNCTQQCHLGCEDCHCLAEVYRDGVG